MDAITIEPFLNKINAVLINPLIALLFILSLILFTFGLIRFFTNPTSTPARDTAKQHMLWGVVGATIMLSVYGIIALLLASFGFESSSYLG